MTQNDQRNPLSKLKLFWFFLFMVGLCFTMAIAIRTLRWPGDVERIFETAGTWLLLCVFASALSVLCLLVGVWYNEKRKRNERSDDL